VQKLGVGIIFSLGMGAHFAEAKGGRLCLSHLTIISDAAIGYNDAKNTLTDFDTHLARVTSMNPKDAVATYEQWLKLADSRPDLVVAATTRLLDAAAKKDIPREAVYLVLVDHIENIVNVTAVEDSYFFLHQELYAFINANLELNGFTRIAEFVVREKLNSHHAYRSDVLGHLEEGVLAFGYKKNLHTYLNDPGGMYYDAAHRWNLLRSRRISDIENTPGPEMLRLVLDEASFISQLSHHVALWKSYLNTQRLVSLLEDDPFLSSYHVHQIQREINKLATPDKQVGTLPMSADFSTRIALKSITQAFLLKKNELPVGKNLDSFFELFKSPTAPRQKDSDYLNQVTIIYSSFVNLAVAWEAVVTWNLESKSEWAISEAQLLEQARGVPDFIFQFVYQETRSSKLRAFMAKLGNLRRRH